MNVREFIDQLDLLEKVTFPDSKLSKPLADYETYHNELARYKNKFKKYVSMQSYDSNQVSQLITSTAQQIRILRKQRLKNKKINQDMINVIETNLSILKETFADLEANLRLKYCVRHCRNYIAKLNEDSRPGILNRFFSSYINETRAKIVELKALQWYLETLIKSKKLTSDTKLLFAFNELDVYKDSLGKHRSFFKFLAQLRDFLSNAFGINKTTSVNVVEKLQAKISKKL